MISLLAVLTWDQGSSADARLVAPIQVAECVATAPQVCADLAKQTGVTIDCDPALKEDLIVLVVKERPAREIMSKLAETFDWEWQPKGAGYQLRPSLNFQRQAVHGRARELLRQARVLRKTVSQQLAALTKTGFRDTEERLAQRLALKCLLAFSDDEIVRLADYRLVLSATPGPLELPISDALIAESDALLDLKRTKMAKEKATSPEKESSIGPPTHLLVSFDSWSSADVVYLDDREQATSYRVGIDQPKEAVPKLEGPVRIAVDAAFKVGGERPIDKTKEPLTAFGRCLFDVSHRVSLDVISDAYDPYIRQDRWEEGRPAFSVQAKLPLKSEGGWLVNRASNWARLREEQVPREVIHFFAEDRERHTMDDSARAASQLRLAQLDSPLFPLTPQKYGFYILLNCLSEPDGPGRHSTPANELPAAAIDYLCSRANPDHPLFELVDAFHPSVFAEPEFTPLTLPSALRLMQKMPDAFPKFAHVYTGLIEKQAQISIQSSSVPSVYDVDRKKTYYPCDLCTPWSPNLDEDVFRPRHMKLAVTHAIQIRIPIKDGLAMTLEDSEVVIGVDLSADERTWPPDLSKRIQAQSTANHAIRTRMIAEANAREEQPPTESGGPPPRS